MSKVNKGLAEVCLMLKDYTKDEKQKKKLEDYSKIFNSFSKINLINKEVKPMAKPISTEDEKKRSECIIELNKLEKKYGTLLFRRACNRKLTIDRQTLQRQREIKRAEKELEQLKGGKPLPQY